jgi:hypothetical protein
LYRGTEGTNRMSASLPPVTTAALIMPRRDIVASNSVADVAQAGLNSPQLLALFTASLGPWVRQHGHSALVGAIGPVLILGAAQLGLTMNEDVSKVLTIALFVVGSYAWQAASIWYGKRNAPVQPAASK